MLSMINLKSGKVIFNPALGDPKLAPALDTIDQAIKRTAQLTSVPLNEEEYREYLRKAEVGALPLAAHQLVNQDSGDFEYMTPPEIIDTVREFFGGTIDLDPASSEDANLFIGAERIYTIENSGLDNAWRTLDDCSTNVWLNHPFGKELTPLFMDKMIAEYEAGNAYQVLNITWASLETEWFQKLWDFPMWVPAGRIAFLDPATGKKPLRWSAKHGKMVTSGPTKAAVITYLGRDIHGFARTFMGRLGGTVYVPYQWDADYYTE